MRSDLNTVPATTAPPLENLGDGNGQSGGSHSQMTGAAQRPTHQTKRLSFLLGKGKEIARIQAADSLSYRQFEATVSCL